MYIEFQVGQLPTFLRSLRRFGARPPVVQRPAAAP